ncbi:MAG: PIG-L family deacetylase [Pseudomonadota bacterium]
MFRELKRFIKFKRASLFRKWVKRRATYHPVSQSSALIIAPHPDDEILGCGGLIALKKSKHAQVFLTQGEAS